MDTFVLSPNFSIHTFVVGHDYQSGGGVQYFCIDDYKSIENEYKSIETQYKSIDAQYKNNELIQK
jgi:hypothetical protein